jgi:hypothetical protein
LTPTTCQLFVGSPVYVVVRRLIIGLLALLAWPAAAQAHGGSHCPVTNSGWGQYGEWIPTAGGCHGTQGGSGSFGSSSGSGGSTHSGGAGGSSSGSGGPGGPSGSPGAVAPQTARALTQHGQAGVKAAGLARATAPTGAHGVAPSNSSKHHGAGAFGRKSGKSSPASGQHQPGSGASSATVPSVAASPASQLAKALTGSSGGVGLGLLLPVILAVTLVGTVVTRILRTRKRAT